MRKNEGHPDCPPIPGESFVVYLDRLAKFHGYIPESEPAPLPFRRKQDRRGFMERLEAIFARPRMAGEDEDSA